MTTRNMIYAKLQMIENLAEEINNLENQIIRDLKIESFKGVEVDSYEKLADLQGGLSSAKSTQKKFEDLGLFEGISIGEPVNIAKISIDEKRPHNVEVSLPLPDGGKMCAYTSLSDGNTVQAGTLYRDKDDLLMDLSLSEVKRGELALMHGKKLNNKDIDVYTWADPYDEDYTDMKTISHDDIEKAFQEIEFGDIDLEN